MGPTLTSLSLQGSPPAPASTLGRLTGAALRVAGTQAPEPRFTAITAWPFHMCPARTWGLCLGEVDTEGQSGPLPSYPQTLSPGALALHHLWHPPEWGQMSLEVSTVTTSRGSNGLSPPRADVGSPQEGHDRLGPGQQGGRSQLWRHPLGHSLVTDPDGKEFPRPGQAPWLPHV